MRPDMNQKDTGSAVSSVPQVADPPPFSEPGIGDRLLADAAERALRAPRGKLAFVLHLSALKPPAPRAHHVRIARALLQDSAQRYGGQVFPLRNGDLVLLCAAPPEDNRLVSGQASPIALPGALARLFGGDAPEPARLSTLWRLDTEGADFRDYLAQRPTNPAHHALPVEEPVANTAALAALEALIATAPVPELLAQQTAIELRPGRTLPLTARLAPLFRELTFSFAAIAEQQDVADAVADPFLFRHFASKLDARMLEVLQADVESAGPLTRATLRQSLPLHLNLTLEGIVSPAFARLVQSARRSGARFGVEISMLEAVSDLPLVGYARTLLDLAGFPLILDGLDQASIVMTHPAGLSPALIKLAWSPRLADAPPPLQAAVDAAISRIGPERIVLARAEAEDALVWGQSRGIARYQGFYLDAVQAAGRIAICPAARACNLRQCMARAGTLAQTVRGACGNPGLLDTTPVPPGAPGAIGASHAPH